MQAKQVTRDDLEDVHEMTKKLEEAISIILSDNDIDLAFSALMSAVINCILGQCENVKEVQFYRDIFIKIVNTSINSAIKLQ